MKKRTTNLARLIFSTGVTIGLALLASSGASFASTAFPDGTPQSIPGTIETEDYDNGGEGDAYHDSDAGNNGPSAYRNDDVDIEGCSDVGGGENVGWTAPGEWLKYTVNVASNGSYTITTRVASADTTGEFHIEIDDVDVTGPIIVGSTGGWQTWQDRTSTVTLSAGVRVLKLVIDGPNANINRFDISYNGPPPAEPTGLQVDSTGANSVSLSWTAPASGSPTGYTVKRATTSGGPYAVVGTTTAPTVSFMDGVTGGSTYYYVISAMTAGGESADSSFVSATPSLGVPDAPTDLKAISGNNQVDLTWVAPTVGSPASYNVMRSTTSGSGYVALTIPGAQTTTSYTDTTAVNGTIYYYLVSAVNVIGEGAGSAQVSAAPVPFATVYEPFDYPIDDNLLSGTPATGTGFTGTWNNGVAGYITPGLTYPDLPVDNNSMRTPAGRQSVSLTNPISSGTKWISYLWNHSPGDPGGNKNGVYFLNGGTGLYFGYGLQVNSATDGYLALASINTVGTAVDTGPALLATTGLHLYGGTKLIVLKIEFDTDGNNDTITVYVNPPANQASPGVPADGTFNGFDVGTISGIGMQVAGGGDFITDEWRIALSYAAVVDAVTIAPDAPTGLSATAGINSVSLSWAAATGGLPTGYNVKRATSAGGPYTTIATTTVPTVTYTDSVEGGSTYYYVVSAENGVGESTDSTHVAATPVLEAPDAPGGVSANAGDSHVSLSWSASTFATSYEVKRAEEISGPYISIDTVATLTYDDIGLTNAVTYYYVIAAIGSGGSSADTTPVSATPFGPLPLVLAIDPGAGVTWFASNGITYQVQWALEDIGEATEWTNLGEAVLGNSETNTVFDPGGWSGYAYRVLSFE